MFNPFVNEYTRLQTPIPLPHPNPTKSSQCPCPKSTQGPSCPTMYGITTKKLPLHAEKKPDFGKCGPKNNARSFLSLLPNGGG